MAKQRWLLTVGIVLLSVGSACAQMGEDVDISTRLEAQMSIQRGVTFLLDHQEDDGSWSRHPGITAMCATAISRSGFEPETVALSFARARQFMIGRADKRTGVFRTSAGDNTQTYSTAACLIALHYLGEPEDAELITAGRRYFLHSQPKLWAQRITSAYGTTTDFAYLSNTHWALESMYITRPSNVTDDRALSTFWHRAKGFLDRCQLLSIADHRDDGCFAYSPAAVEAAIAQHEAKKKADDTAGNDIKVWAQGSFTCAGLKGLLYSGVPAADPRVQKALAWLQRNYTLAENPRAGEAGYYSYIYMLSTLFTALDGDAGDWPTSAWRSALVEALLENQRGAGEWQNNSRMWRERDANLCTAYALIAMQLALGSEAPE